MCPYISLFLGVSFGRSARYEDNLLGVRRTNPSGGLVVGSSFNFDLASLEAIMFLRGGRVVMT